MKWSSPGATGVRSAIATQASAHQRCFSFALGPEKRLASLRFQASGWPGWGLLWVRKVEANTQVVFYVTTGLQMEDKHVVSENGPSDR